MIICTCSFFSFFLPFSISVSQHKRTAIYAYFNVPFLVQWFQVSHNMCMVSAPHEPDECVRQAQKVSGVLGRPQGHIHTPTTGGDRHQESSHDVEEGENIAPGHRQKTDECGRERLRTKVNVDRKVTDPYSLVDKELWCELQHEGRSTGSTLAVETLEMKRKKKHNHLV